MGLSMEFMIYLQRDGHLTPEKNKFLDIGPQNVYFATDTQIRTFVKAQGQTVSDDELEKEIERLVYFSTPRRGERTTLLSEITDLTNTEYNSFDVCPGLKTHILDLNFDPLPADDAERYDVVINFGTTEHILNQWNCFTVMHDAVRVGGVIFCQLPASGYLEHGYFCYTPLFFRELAQANHYEILDIFLNDAGSSDIRDSKIDVRDTANVQTRDSAGIARDRCRIPQFNILALMRKTRSARFRGGLEIATAHSGVDPQVTWRYMDHEQLRGALAEQQKRLDKVREQDNAIRDLEAIRNSTSWKITAPLRRLARLVGR